jgi:hypothetical protein
MFLETNFYELLLKSDFYKNSIDTNRSLIRKRSKIRLSLTPPRPKTQNAYRFPMFISKIASKRRCKENTQNAYEEREPTNECALLSSPRRFFLELVCRLPNTSCRRHSRRRTCRRSLCGPTRRSRPPVGTWCARTGWDLPARPSSEAAQEALMRPTERATKSDGVCCACRGSSGH